MSTDQKPDWQPPLHDKTGVAIDGGESGLPLNFRLRAEALVALGKTSDPEGLITDELIADTATRLKAEAEAGSKASTPPPPPAPPPPAPPPPAPPKTPATTASPRGE